MGMPPPALAAPATFTVGGSVTSNCKIGTGSYSVSINWVKNTSAQISIDGTAGNTQTTAGGTTTATHSYATDCNGPTTLHMNVPATTTSAITYTITVKDGGGTTIATASSVATNVNVAIPITNSNWTLTATATYQSGNPVTGTYTATVTIQ